MQIVRKSEDENTVIVHRAAGYAVSVREPRWANEVAFRGTQVMEWNCVAKGLSQAAADRLFDSLTQKAA